MREQFLIELAVPGALAKITGLTQLNELFTAWVETVYHQRVHSETGQPPLARFTTAVPPVLPTPAALREAFLWSEHRLVAKTATLSLHSNTYEVDAALVGRRVELDFDPFDLTDLAVRYQGRDMGVALGHQIGRHVHPGRETRDQSRPRAAYRNRLPRPGVRPTHRHPARTTSELRGSDPTHHQNRWHH